MCATMKIAERFGREPAVTRGAIARRLIRAVGMRSGDLEAEALSKALEDADRSVDPLPWRRVGSEQADDFIRPLPAFVRASSSCASTRLALALQCRVIGRFRHRRGQAC